MPITPTYANKAVNVPAMIAPISPAIGAGSSGDFASGMVTGVSTALNQLLAALKLLGQNGGGANCICGAVGTALALSAGTGLNVVVAPGVALMDRPLEFVASGAVSPAQVNVPAPYTLTDSTVNYVWLTNLGVLTAATSLTPPAGSRIYLGAVTCAGGVITAIDFGGVAALSSLGMTRTTGDVGPPTDTPPFPGVLTLTTTGVYGWNGSYHQRHEPPANVQTISGTKTMTALDSRMQLLTASGGAQTVKLPALTALEVGAAFTIWNQGASNNITIQTSSGGSISGGLTLTPGQAVPVLVCTSAGTNAWPSSGVTAVTPSTGGVVGPGT